MVATRGPRTLVAVCPPCREALTFGPIVDAARQAAPSGADVSGLGLSALAGTLRPLFSKWADGLPPAPEPPADASAARHQLIRAFAEFLDRLGIDVLVVKDVHWADETTLEFLLFLASPQPFRLTLVMTCRPGEVAADSLLPAEFTVDVRHRFGVPWSPLSVALPRRSCPGLGSGCPTGRRRSR